MEVYPEHPWDPAGFSNANKMPPGYWNIIDNQRDLLERIASELRIQQVTHLLCCFCEYLYLNFVMCSPLTGTLSLAKCLRRGEGGACCGSTTTQLKEY